MSLTIGNELCSIATTDNLNNFRITYRLTLSSDLVIKSGVRSNYFIL